MFKKIALFIIIGGVGLTSGKCLAEQNTESFAKTVYTETPVNSYLATVDDVNFIPESEFMQRTDSLNYDQNIDAARQAQAVQAPGVQFASKPVIVCRDYGCTKLNDRITRTFLFNSLTNMFLMNTNSRLNICEADPFTRACLQSGISFPVKAGIASALVKIPRATINGVSLSTGLSKATVGIKYDFLVNGISVQCEPTAADIVVPANTNAMLTNREFTCNMTTDALTNVSLMINLDYIDLDYGIIGGYYSFGLQGPTSGGGTGYALFKTEFTTKGIAVTNTNGKSETSNDQQVIRPGEYAVEPLEK
jgi:hypothetical protein